MRGRANSHVVGFDTPAHESHIDAKEVLPQGRRRNVSATARPNMSLWFRPGPPTATFECVRQPRRPSRGAPPGFAADGQVIHRNHGRSPL